MLAQGKQLDYSAMLFAQTSQCDHEELFWSDVLGLADGPEDDQCEVYAVFQEQLTCRDEG